MLPTVHYPSLSCNKQVETTQVDNSQEVFLLKNRLQRNQINTIFTHVGNVFYRYIYLQSGITTYANKVR